MLEELTLINHRMEGGWLSALSYCENLKTLKFQSCKRIDCDPGPDEHLGSCPALERLHLEQCQLRDKQSVRSLFLMCETVREIVFQNCWGLDNDLSSIAGICRYGDISVHLLVLLSREEENIAFAFIPCYCCYYKLLKQLIILNSLFQFLFLASTMYGCSL